jgi:tetratricopeptide (TPR) repeat protein
MSSPSLSTPASKPGLSLGAGSDLKGNPGNRKRLYLWVGVLVVIGMLWAVTNQDASKTESKKKADKTEEEKFKPSEVPEFEESMKSAVNPGLEDPITKTEKEVTTLENKETSAKEAEVYFRKGQRDYFNKNYHHAIDNFDAALSLWNKHPLAGYYKGLAIHDSEVEADKNREIGLKYFNSLQYNRAIYHFKAAIDYLSHVKSENASAKRMIQECERYMELSRRKLKAMELVP